MFLQERPTVLTGDRPTGILHLGHYVGSIQKRVLLQGDADCFFIVADLHAMTTYFTKEEISLLPGRIHDLVASYLAFGIDPEKSVIYLQSGCPAIFKMNFLFQLITSANRVMGLPSIKEMAHNAKMEDEKISFGLLGYPILQSADILMSQATLVPVGKDNVAHIEIARDIARRFNQLYGTLFPLPQECLSEMTSLPGIDGKGKMSKSAGNAIFISDDYEVIRKKVFSMYTDPNRTRSDIPGRVENNPLFIYHDIFNSNVDEVNEFKSRYREGKIGDVEVKSSLAHVLNSFLDPIREKFYSYRKDVFLLDSILEEGTSKMRVRSEKLVGEMCARMGLYSIK
ncbi:tryptophan--tRNA ligase [Candidatus Similichlamydia epinepheli]|uniref:tryptophan--tRNA ligase n=1 Tax=Candidatus Similichlamydia epinepheli TaxID=1903953 RepID=UPI000D3C61C6|nr:tryptophan--tRNA ligase [Candidatus Similichlamydia epinepheli]